MAGNNNDTTVAKTLTPAEAAAATPAKKEAPEPAPAKQIDPDQRLEIIAERILRIVRADYAKGYARALQEGVDFYSYTGKIETSDIGGPVMRDECTAIINIMQQKVGRHFYIDYDYFYDNIRIFNLHTSRMIPRDLLYILTGQSPPPLPPK